MATVRVYFRMCYPWQMASDETAVGFVLASSYAFPSALAAHLWIRELSKLADPLQLEDVHGTIWSFYRGSYDLFLTADVAALSRAAAAD